MLHDLRAFAVTPSNLTTILLVAGVLLFVFKSTRKASRWFVSCALVTYLTFAVGPVSFWLLGRLEYEHPYLRETVAVRDAAYIVVLAAYSDNDRNVPLSSRVNSSAAFRLMEARRIHSAIPRATIIISGSEGVADIMKDVLVSLGIDEEFIEVDGAAGNTFASAQNVKKMVGDTKFILVTSAGHMPRSMKVFLKAGMQPIPAPTDYLTYRNYMAISYLPSPLHLQYSDLAVHEYIGILWYRWRGHI